MDALGGGRSDLRDQGLGGRIARPLALASVAVVLAGLVGRILTYPLQHDEQFYLPPGMLIDQYALYRDIGFTHVPNLPLLISAIVAIAGESQTLIMGRWLIVVAWASLLAALYRAGRTQGAGSLAIVTACALLVFDTNLLGEAGMAATNNFLPIPFAVGGAALLLAAVQSDRRAPLLAFGSGLLLALAAGFKINFAPVILPAALATLLVPKEWPLRARMVRLTLPMFAGGLIGASPTLIMFLRDPADFLVHVFAAHRGPQIAYWLANPDPADPKIMTIGAKLIFARDLWLGSTALLMMLSLGVLALLLRQQAGGWPKAARLAGWQTVVLGSMIAIAGAVAFLPTPAFPQYYVLPFPFAALLLLVLHGRLDAARRANARPVLIVVTSLALLNGLPSLLPALRGFIQPGNWAGERAKADGIRLAQALRANGAEGPVATLEPLQALTGGVTVYPELALGPFVYRAADWIPPAQRAHYPYLTSPSTIGARLEAQRPSAVLVGRNPRLDAPLEQFALSHGYRPMPLLWESGGEVRTRTLFLPRPAAPALR